MKEANKFREHQARELMIEMLEGQLKERKEALAQIQHDIATAKTALTQLTLVERENIQHN